MNQLNKKCSNLVPTREKLKNIILSHLNIIDKFIIYYFLILNRSAIFKVSMQKFRSYMGIIRF